MKKKITPFLISLGAFLAVLAIGFGVFYLFRGSTVPSNTGLSSSTGNTVNPFATLKPAIVPSKTPECQQTLTYASSGEPSPVQCSNGDLNVLAWKALAALEPTVMKLGYTSSQSQVMSAMCTDINVANQDATSALSEPVEASAYQLASLYYGWHYNINPRFVITGC